MIMSRNWLVLHYEFPPLWWPWPKTKREISGELQVLPLDDRKKKKENSILWRLWSKQWKIMKNNVFSLKSLPRWREENEFVFNSTSPFHFDDRDQNIKLIYKSCFQGWCLINILNIVAIDESLDYPGEITLTLFSVWNDCGSVQFFRNDHWNQIMFVFKKKSVIRGEKSLWSDLQNHSSRYRWDTPVKHLSERYFMCPLLQKGSQTVTLPLTSPRHRRANDTIMQMWHWRFTREIEWAKRITKT